jgi:ParB/RepB/Spo0J family partition protein
MANTIAMKAIAVGRKDVFMVPESYLKEEDGFNARLQYTEIPEFALYIKANGVNELPPLMVYKKKDAAGDEGLYISKGHRRIRAIRMAINEHGCDIKGVPCMFDAGNEESRTFGLITENTQVPLTNLEQGLVFHRLIGYGYTQVDIAEKIGKSQPFVHKCITLAKMPKKVQDLLAANVVDDSTVYDAAKGAEPEAVYDILMKSLEVGGTARGGVRAAVHKAVGKKTLAAQAKTLGEWVEENSVILKEDSRYQAVAWAYNFVTAKNNDFTLDGLDKLFTRTK